MNKIFNSFKFPPVEERTMIGGILKEITYPRHTVDSPDTYLYYRLFINGLKINFFVLSLYLIIHILWKNSIVDIPDFFVIRTLGESFSITYPLVASPILLIFMIIYTYLHYKANIDIHKIDFLWWVKSTLTEGDGADRKTVMKAMKRILFMLVICMLIMSGPALWLMYHAHVNAQSYIFVALVALFDCWLLSTAIAYLASSYLTYYQHKHKLGPRYSGENK